VLTASRRVELLQGRGGGRGRCGEAGGLTRARAVGGGGGREGGERRKWS
jgi:hypothetical protein